MRLAHLSDLHLGYRQYQRLTPGGVNQREADVAATFRVAVDRLIGLRPNLIVVAGDIFHTVRPTNQAILHAFLQFARLRRELPDSEVVLIAGNHDTPRSSESGGILRLFGQLGLNIADRQAEQWVFPKLDLSVLAIPDVRGQARPSMQPNRDARFNVMVVHGEVEGVLPAHLASAERAALEISHEELGAARWDYVALGHYHVYREVAPNAFYSGSIEYTSANTWGELYEERLATLPGKGFVERDLATKQHTFHPLPAARPLVDLPPIIGRACTAAQLDEQIRAAVDSCPNGIDDKIVRLLVRDMPRHLPRELDHKAIRDYKRRALNFQLDFRAPESAREHAAGAPGRRPSLNDLVKEKLLARPLNADVDRGEMVRFALDYLDRAQAMNVAPSAVDEA